MKPVYTLGSFVGAVLNTAALLVMGAINVHAEQAPAQADPAVASLWSSSVTPSFVTEYMFRGQLLDGASFQPAAEVDYGNFALGVWSSIPLTNKVPGQSDPEVDLYGSYKYAVSDAFNIQPGFTLYTYPNAPTDQGFYRSSFEPNVALNYTYKIVTLTPKVYYDTVLRGPTWEFSTTCAAPLTPVSSELDFTATVGTYRLSAAAPSTSQWGNYWLAGVSVPYAVTATSKLALGYAYTVGNGYTKVDGEAKTPNASAVGRGVVSVVYTLNF